MTANNPQTRKQPCCVSAKCSLKTGLHITTGIRSTIRSLFSIMDMLIESFAHAGVGAPLVQHLRRYACELYHQACLEAAPETTFQANMQLMFSYLPASGRKRWRP